MTHGTRRLLRGWRVCLVVGLLVLGGPPARADRPAADAEAGRAAYGQHCARCHGPTGGGDGVDARRFYPRPRDLSYGVYKFRSTVSGTPPTDDDLLRVITEGLPGSNMPDWAHLDEATRWHLVEYLKSLSDVFEEVEPAPVTFSPDPGSRGADLAKGRAIYEQSGCAACHGEQGRANGGSAAGLVDDWGMPIRPANLTQGWAYRGGRDPWAVMMRFLTGIDGSGMPSYAEVVSPEDAWHLAYYVVSLQEPEFWNRMARGTWVPGSLPGSVEDPRWDAVERTTLQLRQAVDAEGTWVQAPTITHVTLQIAFTATDLAVRLVWDDPTRDSDRPDADQALGGASPADALALLFKPDGAQGDVVTLQAWPLADAPALDLCYWLAERQQAAEVVAQNFEEIVQGRLGTDTRASAARYADGQWQLVVQRPRVPAAPAGAAPLGTSPVPDAVAVVVWDGGNPGARAMSTWVDVDLRAAETVARRTP